MVLYIFAIYLGLLVHNWGSLSDVPLNNVLVLLFLGFFGVIQLSTEQIVKAIKENHDKNQE